MIDSSAFNTSLALHLEQKLGLLPEEEPGTHNLCFANRNAELRNEFKRVFTRQDLYYYTLVHPAGPLPETADSFWLDVEKGKKPAL